MRTVVFFKCRGTRIWTIEVAILAAFLLYRHKFIVHGWGQVLVPVTE